jgi:hypothetical protein
MWVIFPTMDSDAVYEGITWETLHEQKPPAIVPYLPSTSKDGEALRSTYKIRDSFERDDDFDDHLLAAWGLKDQKEVDSKSRQDSELRRELLAKQVLENKW